MAGTAYTDSACRVSPATYVELQSGWAPAYTGVTNFSNFIPAATINSQKPANLGIMHTCVQD